MPAARSQFGGRPALLSLCHIICLCATWIRITQALPWAVAGDYAHPAEAVGGLDLIPSAGHDSASTPPLPIQSQVDPTGLVPSTTPTSQVPQISQPSVLSSVPASITPVPPAPVTPGPMPIGSAPIPSNAVSPSSTVNTGTSVMSSTDEGLKPIPPAATQIGDPNGHHEITEPNFSATKICQGCSPVVEVSASGWLDGPAGEQHGTTTEAAKVTISAGPSNILISQGPASDDFVIGGSITVTPGQTITVDNTPVAVHTSGGRLEVVIGTAVIPLTRPSEVITTEAPQTIRIPTPLPPVLTIGSDAIVANSQTQYVVSGQTISPGGAAITVGGTTISLAPSATAVVVNGATSSLVPNFGYVYTTAAPALTFNNHVYTFNRAGYITLSPGNVLKPGGEPITVDGTTLSLDHSGTAIVIQGSTSFLQVVSTVVTLTRSVGAGSLADGNAGQTSGGSWTLPTEKGGAPAKPVSEGSLHKPGLAVADGLCLMLLFWWGLGYLAVES